MNKSKIVEIVETAGDTWADWKVVHTCTQCGEADPGVSHTLGMIVGYRLLEDATALEADPTTNKGLIGQLLEGAYLCWKCVDSNIDNNDEWGGLATR